VIYAGELGEAAVLTFTRDAPAGWPGHRGHIADALVAGVASSLPGATAFVCVLNGFVESASVLLLDGGVAPERIRTERFGPTGQP
jgi:ferredoxin-NADP reductase